MMDKMKFLKRWVSLFLSMMLLILVLFCIYALVAFAIEMALTYWGEIGGAFVIISFIALFFSFCFTAATLLE